MTETGTEVRAEIRLPTQELRDDLPFYTKVLGFRLDMIFPADNPQVAVLSGHGLRLRIEKGATSGPKRMRLVWLASQVNEAVKSRLSRSGVPCGGVGAAK